MSFEQKLDKKYYFRMKFERKYYTFGAMNIFAFECYKTLIKSWLKTHRQRLPHLTLKRLAQRLEIQYTYLSKVLNSDVHHLGEDQIFQTALFFQFHDDETDFFLLLRSHNTTADEKRRNDLERKLQSLRRARDLRARPVAPDADNSLTPEVQLLLRPEMGIVLLALHNKTNQKNLARVCHGLQIPYERMKSLLKFLTDHGFLETNESLSEIKKIIPRHVHYSPEHPFMRLHQQLLKQYGEQHFANLAEKDKTRFMVTFNADEITVCAIKDRWKKFIAEIEELVTKAPVQGTYQMNFELFPWLA